MTSAGIAARSGIHPIAFAARPLVAEPHRRRIVLYKPAAGSVSEAIARSLFFILLSLPAVLRRRLGD
jgi:hypothetical protein